MFESFESSAASFKSKSGTRIVLLVIYRTGNISAVCNKEMDKLLSELLLQCDCIILAGDLNIHFEQVGTKLYKQALEMFESCGLKRKVFEPTHISGGSIDHIFTFSLHDQLQSNVIVDSKNTLMSDHFPVYCTFNMSYEKKTTKAIEYRKLKDINKSEFSTELSNLMDESFLAEPCFKKSVSLLSR